MKSDKGFMSEWVIFHNPRCSKSRQALALLQERGIQPKVIDYLKRHSLYRGAGSTASAAGYWTQESSPHEGRKI